MAPAFAVPVTFRSTSPGESNPVTVSLNFTGNITGPFAVADGDGPSTVGTGVEVIASNLTAAKR